MQEEIEKCCRRHVLPGCVWDWSRPTLWLLQREILGADWCLVARRLGHLGRGRHCCRRIRSRVTGMVRKVQERAFIHISIISHTRFYNFTPHCFFVFYCSSTETTLRKKDCQCIIYTVVSLRLNRAWLIHLKAEVTLCFLLVNHFLNKKTTATASLSHHMWGVHSFNPETNVCFNVNHFWGNNHKLQFWTLFRM